MSESTNIPILCIPNNNFVCEKTNQMLYISILLNKQKKKHVHPNKTKGLKDDYKLIMFSEKKNIKFGNLAECQKPYTQCGF